MIKHEIQNLIKKQIKNLQRKKKLPAFMIDEVKVEIPENESHGDYSTNVAMVVCKKVKKNPMQTAELIVSDLKSDSFEKIEAVEPGFINFFVSNQYLQEQVKEILNKKNKCADLKIGKGRKVQVEFISANPTGPLTLGNARGGAFGDVLANVLKKAGYETEKAYYINDYGNQVMMLGHSVLKDDKAQYKGDYIDYLHKKVKGTDPYKVGEKAAKIIIKEMIKKTTDRFGIKYDEWTSETSFYKSGAVDRALEFLKKKGLLYEKEGALWFKSRQFGDDRDRVVVKSDGWKTYLAGDIAHHRYKFEEKKFDKVINVWGADHFGDIVGLQAAVEALGHKGKLDIIILQFVTLFEKGKQLRMSKRKGIYVTIDELLDEIGTDAARFFFLNKSADTHLNFDLELAKKKSQENPVYYVQYAHARICSILRKVKNGKAKADPSLLKHDSEVKLIKHLIKFPEIVEDVSRDYQVQKLPQYAVDLAALFHRFYQECTVLSDDEKLKKARLSLILAVKIVLKDVFDLMGISAPERM